MSMMGRWEFVPHPLYNSIVINAEDEDEDDDDGTTSYDLDIPLPEYCETIRNPMSIIILDGEYAIKIPRSRKQLLRELRYYEIRETLGKIDPNELRYHGLSKWPSGDYGLVLERIDQAWLKENYKHDILGIYREDGMALPLVERIHARMLLRQSASWLSPYHGQINVRDIVVTIKQNTIIRACIIDHGDQPGEDYYSTRELESVLEERGLLEFQGLVGYLIGRGLYFWYKVFLLLPSTPGLALRNALLLVKDILNHIKDFLNSCNRNSHND
ncbi:uncharacterized protein PV09_09669 [Verruconis gallopava]|uniref:Uncharacterized protein n=1 Tax=Verruconis gallopava TaxID=253628 RepID=A0A0D1X915_9PEZI|nr:uncharacterized protein PV09_09669 [Verruconis gallopava]KIV98535.1 hypothetical protein PV09_09669 [Verruconis gallopava]